MQLESELLESVKERYKELLETIVTNYSVHYDSTQCHPLFEACFDLSDFICQAESEEYLNIHSLRTASALYVTKSISDLIDRLELDAQDDLDSVRDAALWQGTRMSEAFAITQNYFENDGLLEILGSSRFYTNFKNLTD